MIRSKMKILPYGKHFISKEDIKAVSNVLLSTHLTQGKAVSLFEKKIANCTGAKYAVAVSSCTAGMHIACKAIGFTTKSKLLTSVVSFVSSPNVAYFLGGQVNFVDINPKTIAFDIHDLKNKIIKYKPDIVMPVHIGGCSYNYEYIKDLSLKYNFKIIEDAAHSFGGKYNNKFKIGSCKFSDLTVFSFHPVKTITTGEGGVITTNNKEYYLKLLRLRSHGINKLDDSFLIKKQAYTNGKKNQWYYEMRELGYHYRITDIQCALGISQLNKLPDVLKKRKKIFSIYDKAFSNLSYIKPLQIDKRQFSSYHLYVVDIDFKKIKKTRQALMAYLEKNKIFTQVHYLPLVMHPFYKRLKFNIKDYLNAKKYYEGCLSLPCFFSLSEEDQKFIIKKIKFYLES